MSNTFSEFVAAVAFGDQRSRTLSEEDANRVHQEMCEAVGPAIEALRLEQRKTNEDQLSILLF
ncbi:hypothetical protein [Xanthomonas arboricola]|uniref:hypothetical protein n=1 Tax=Xanthomonas arboricola TaxID=56448 RepID=UPI0012D31D66|nr:hypothetical protein [Xanthomonas arboricola]